MSDRPKCLLCGERRARVIEASHVRRPSVYKYGVETPVFCSVRCAANWALIECGVEARDTWCPQCDDWVPDEERCYLHGNTDEPENEEVSA